MVASTSRRLGTLSSSVSQGASTEAAMMGSTAFFAPCTVTLPRSRAPPLICQTLIFSPPNSKFTPFYAGDAGKVKTPREARLKVSSTF